MQIDLHQLGGARKRDHRGKRRLLGVRDVFLIFTDFTDIYTHVCTSMYTYVHIHMCMSKLIQLYALNMCTSFYANYTLIKF